MKKKVMITGVCGTIGEDLAKYFLANNTIVYGVDYQETQLALMKKSLNSLEFFPFQWILLR